MADRNGTRTALVLAIALTAAPALASPADIETLRSECAAQLNQSPGGCDCIADTATGQLNDNQQALVAAMVTKDQARADQVRGGMTMDEITGSAQFMMTAPQLCAGQ